MNWKKAVFAILLLALNITLSACDEGRKIFKDAESLFDKSDYVAAKDKATELVQNAPKSKYLSQSKDIIEKSDNIQALLKAAKESSQKGAHDKSMKAYEDILVIHPRSTSALDGLKTEADAVTEEGNFEIAAKAYNKILSFSPNDGKAKEGLKYAESVLSEVKNPGDNEKASPSDIKIEVIKAQIERQNREVDFSSCEFRIRNDGQRPVRLSSVEFAYNMLRPNPYDGFYDATLALPGKTVLLNIILPKGKTSKVISTMPSEGCVANTCRFYPDKASAGINITLNTSEGNISKGILIYWNAKEEKYSRFKVRDL